MNRPGAFAEFIVLPMSNIWRHNPKINPEIAAIFDPFGNAVHTALSFPVLGEDVLITGAGPIGIMAAALQRWCDTRAPAMWSSRTSIPIAWPLQKKWASLSLLIRERHLSKRYKSISGCKRNSMLVWRCSGSPAAFSEMLANVSHGAKIAVLGIPASEMAIDWHRVIFNMLTIKGIYGREMYETWYKMTVMLEPGLDISPVITHRFSWSDYEQGFEVMRSGESGKVILFGEKSPDRENPTPE